jgi:hypothetical protein
LATKAAMATAAIMAMWRRRNRCGAILARVCSFQKRLAIVYTVRRRLCALPVLASASGSELKALYTRLCCLPAAGQGSGAGSLQEDVRGGRGHLPGGPVAWRVYQQLASGNMSVHACMPLSGLCSCTQLPCMATQHGSGSPQQQRVMLR